MRLKGANQVHYDSGPNMTPLVDVVMVILIFLMLAGSFGGAEHYLKSSTPINKNGTGQVKDAPLPDETTFMITVDDLGDRFNARPDGMDPIQDEAALTTALSAKLAAFRDAGTDLNKIQVVISPSRQAKYEFLIQVYEAALQAGYTKVAFEQPHD
jgi:biopolymer transport protein ExbD